ncbi:MAG: hypothetical protein IJ694_04570 [Acidaminococcaceae bacterium]|nr:hypothetical protein [Acidaminococcaceae bacterium]
MIKDLLEANETVSANALEIEKLKRALPQCFDKEGNFKMNTFQELLKGKVSVYNEGYELKFLGKSYGRLLAALHTTTVVEPDLAHNGKEENKNSENVYVSGDNLDALKHLLKSYEGSIKAIYIDPPYNTGSDGFVYNDKFTFTRVQLEEKLDVSPEEAERILEMTRRGSASHSAWLTFMYPRLLLARDLLSEDGVIFISIDDNEQANLKMLCDSIFGEENFIGTIIQNKQNAKNDSLNIQKNHEYIIVYRKRELIEGDSAKASLIFNVNKYKDVYEEDGQYFYLNDSITTRGEGGTLNARHKLGYTIYYNPITNDKKAVADYDIELAKTSNIFEDVYTDDKTLIERGYVPIRPPKVRGKLGCWTWKLEKFNAEKNEIYINGNNGNYVVRKRTFINKKDVKNIDGKLKYLVSSQANSKSILDFSTNAGTNMLNELMGQADLFNNPKNVDMLVYLLGLINDDHCIILDFFSGSGTTAQAVMELNAQDNGARKFIMVQWQEETKENSTARKEGYATIDQIGMERIRRAAEKIRKEHPDTTADLGFKHYTLREPDNDLLAQLEEFTPDTVLAEEPDHILKQFGVPTVITTWLLRDGYGFNAPVQQLDLAGYEAWLCEKHLYLIGEGFSIEAMKALYEKYDTDDTFAVENIIIFGYSFTWTEAQMIKNNLFKIKADDNINRLVNLEIRY